MKKIGIFMADGCEEIEGLTVVDILRRAKIDAVMISVTEERQIIGSHDIIFATDKLSTDINYDELDGVVLPGGVPGTRNLMNHMVVNALIKKFASEGKLVAAICGASTILGAAGILTGKNAVCYPGHEEHLIGATCLKDNVVTDGNIITSRGMGTAIDFALEIVRYFQGNAAVQELKKSIVYK